jgi:hypothetical protein
MFRDFSELKDELLAKNETFSFNTLGLLAYRDLYRAAIADAGTAACTPELVVQEQRRRLETADLTSTQELVDQGMVADYQAYVRLLKLEALPAWAEQTCLVRLYFLIRCLRSHADNPEARLQQVLGLANEGLHAPDGSIALSTLLGIIYAGAHDLLGVLQQNGLVDLRHIRRAFQGSGLLLNFMEPWDRTVCVTLNVKGYTCTAGCFIPVTPEG